MPAADASDMPDDEIAPTAGLRYQLHRKVQYGAIRARWIPHQEPNDELNGNDSSGRRQLSHRSSRSKRVRSRTLARRRQPGVIPQGTSLDHLQLRDWGALPPRDRASGRAPGQDPVEASSPDVLLQNLRGRAHGYNRLLLLAERARSPRRIRLYETHSAPTTQLG